MSSNWVFGSLTIKDLATAKAALGAGGQLAWIRPSYDSPGDSAAEYHPPGARGNWLMEQGCEPSQILLEVVILGTSEAAIEAVRQAVDELRAAGGSETLTARGGTATHKFCRLIRAQWSDHPLPEGGSLLALYGALTFRKLAPNSSTQWAS
jgi:hypothetical protein